MDNPNDKVDIKEEDLQEINLSEEELNNDTTDWKAKALEFQGIAKRRGTQLGKAKAKFGEYEEKIKTLQPKPESQPKNDKEQKPSGKLDYGQKAYAIASGIKPDEMHLLEEAIVNTGKTLEEVLANGYFQNTLKEHREAIEVKNALPKDQGRGSPTAKDQVGYWLAKGGLPPNTPENQKLRREVVAARRKAADTSSEFTDNPIGNKIDIQ